MTLAAPKSRRGRFSLATAILAVLVAAVGALLWQQSASAVLPTITVTFDDNAGASVNPGEAITYTATITVSGVAAETPNTVFTVNLDDGLTVGVIAEAGTLFDAADCSAGAGNVITCTDATADAENHTTGTITIPTTAGQSDIVAPAACSYDDADAGTGPEACTINATGITVAGVSVDPASATNLIGQSETFTWTLPAGYTCESDANFSDTLRSCTAADVTLDAGGTGAVVTAGPTVSDTDLTVEATVTVTIGNATAAGTATVTLLTKFQDDDVAFIETDNVSATKTFQDLAAVGDARLVHVDVDDGTEDVADDGVLDAVDPEVGGVLIIQDDPDDATGSLHTVCLLSGALGAGDNANITWDIQPTAGSDANAVFEVGDGEVILDVNTGLLGDADNTEHDDDEANCVQWRSGGVGGQTILATYVPTGEVVGWDNDSDDDSGSGVGDPPLIKQWNDIDETKIVQVDGTLGDATCDVGGTDTCGDISANTGELDNWSQRNCDDDDSDPANGEGDNALDGYCGRANWDTATIEVSGTEFSNDFIFAGSVEFIDYTFGDHDNYNGPIDGVEQNYSVSGSCGSVRLEDPVTGDVRILFPGDDFTLLNSDKGVGFQVLPNDDGALVTDIDNANCEDGDSITVTITSEEDVQLRSDLDDAPDEEVTVRWVHGPGENKQPQLAWVGQRVVLENDWREPDGSCPWNDVDPEGGFWVRYAIQHPSPGFISTVPGEEPAVMTGPDFIIVHVETGDDPDVANDDCISRAIYESQEVGEVDVTAHVVEPGSIQAPTGPDTNQILTDEWTVISPEYDFLVYYMKLEDVTFTAEADTAVVSDDVGLTVMVRGWTVLPSGGNCPQRPEAVDSHGGVLPANRCIFPDDWDFLGGPFPELDAPNLDIWGGSNAGCSTEAAGPFSLLDPPGCDTTGKAPNSELSTFREANFPDEDVNDLDAPMPPAEVMFMIDIDDSDDDNSGFLLAADSGKSPWDRANIPAEPWITTAGSGYRWDSYGGGTNSGHYNFWEIADHSAEVVSCGGASEDTVDDGNPATDECGDGSGVLTGGFKQIFVYSDNHGEAQAIINGDADLDFQGCFDNSTPTPVTTDGGSVIKAINGFYCNLGDIVGVSTVDVVVNYPDKQGKHYPLAAGPLTITWTWGGIKEITVEQTAGDQFSYITLHVTDRDGFCSDSPSLHPVLGEQVDWLIDSGDGTIVDGELLGSIGILGQSATTFTFSADDNPLIARPKFVSSGDECQSWIQVVSTLLNEVDVLTTAHDPEGLVTFDTILNKDSDNDGVRDADDNCPDVFNPDQADDNGFEDGTGEGDACEVVPTPTPEPTLPPDLWGDVDCDDDVDTVDALKVLRSVAGLFIDQTGACFGVGDNITVDGDAQLFGDWDCNGDVTPNDALAVLLFVVNDPLEPAGCPVVGDLVDIQ
jgi:hypothetical protein